VRCCSLGVAALETPARDVLPPFAVMARMLSGYAVSQLIFAAAKLGLADQLDSAPRASDELARESDANPEILARIMRALQVLGVVHEGSDGRFELTPVGRLLIRDAPGSMHALALLGDDSYAAWSHLSHTIETGEAAFDACFGLSRFEYLAEHPEAAVLFNRAMSGMSEQNAVAVVNAFDFSRFGRIVDVGGGRGALISAILEANPAAAGVLADTEGVVADVEPELRRRDLVDRCELVAVDFFDSIPAGGDAYVLSQTIHNWDDSHAVRILQNCSRAMTADGTVLVIEMVMPDELEDSPMNYPLVMTDLQMMVMTGGRERTVAEHRRLLEAAGLTLEDVVPTRGPLAILKASAASPGPRANPAADGHKSAKREKKPRPAPFSV
jgi:hypothetical protein